MDRCLVYPKASCEPMSLSQTAKKEGKTLTLHDALTEANSKYRASRLSKTLVIKFKRPPGIAK